MLLTAFQIHLQGQIPFLGTEKWSNLTSCCGQDIIGYCNYCICERVHAPIPHIETHCYFHNCIANFRTCSIFPFSISKVIGLSPVLPDMLASESLKIHVLPILFHLPSDFCTQSKMFKWQFLWLACNSSVAEKTTVIQPEHFNPHLVFP